MKHKNYRVSIYRGEKKTVKFSDTQYIMCSGLLILPERKLPGQKA